jgi:hypothetical protein
MGIGSLPVQLGARPRIAACWMMAVPQLVVVVLLLHWGAPLHAAAWPALLAVQGADGRFLAAPAKQALWYSGLGVTLFVIGMLVSLRAAQPEGQHEPPARPPEGALTCWLAGSASSGWAWCRPAGRGRGADHLDAEPRDGGRTGLPALVPGLLVALHYAVQMTRPAHGHGSDVGGAARPGSSAAWRCWRWAAWLAALATAWMGTTARGRHGAGGAGFFLVGLGVSAGGTSLLVLLAKRVAPERRAAAATAGVGDDDRRLCGHRRAGRPLLDPYTPQRLVMVSAAVSLAWLVADAGCGRPGRPRRPRPAPRGRRAQARFREALAQVWADPTRAASRSSSSSRCWPTARRT